MQLVQGFDADPEELHGKVLDVLFVQLMLVNEFEDEFLLLLGTLPLLLLLWDVDSIVEPLLVSVSIWCTRMGTMGVTISRVTVMQSCFVAVLFRHISLVLQLTIHTRLQKSVEPGGFLFDLREINQFTFDGDAELVTAVARQAELFGVVCFKLNCHRFTFDSLEKRMRSGGEMVLMKSWERKRQPQTKKTALREDKKTRLIR